VNEIAAVVARQVDLDGLLAIAADVPPLGVPGDAVADPWPPVEGDIRIGVAQDRAFGFYYADDLDALRAAGATLVRVDTLADAQLPNVDALFIGGGFPELYAAELEANAALRTRIRSAVDAGLPVYAECGGLMYLARSLTHNGRTFRMVGAIPGDVVMHERPVGRGYVNLEETAAFPWPAAPAGTAPVRAHEFHYSSLENLPADLRCAYAVKRGHGIDGERDGIVVNNVLASYAHLRSANGNAWAARFVDFVRHAAYRRSRSDNIVYLAPARGRETLVV
jgi:cobyrinic acid a,c-diamide synthase